MENNTTISASICISDLIAIIKANPEKVIKGKEKSYINLDIRPKKEPDTFGNDVSISFSKTKEEREAKADTIYVGSGKTFVFEPTTTPATAADVNQMADDLPF